VTHVTVIGLGYVGLPLALAFGKRSSNGGHVTGFDINQRRIAELQQAIDHTHEASPEDLAASQVFYTSNPDDLAGTDIFIVTVPTPIDIHNKPDLTPLRKASTTIGRYLKPGAIVCYESTVYPGVTEEVCGPILAEISGLRCGVDFTLGYSPERINPGDKEHTLARITKVVAGQDAATLQRLAELYGAIIDAGLHLAPSIKVAEAAKVIENTQRDLNIALMNELALIFDRLGIRTTDVLAAARTKWNFLPFSPGLVGGHCIGVDPYYLTTKAEELGYYPQVILAGRRINNAMGAYIAQQAIKMMIAADLPIKGARLGILGLTFKENVPDLRNSRVPDIVRELQSFGVEPIVHDPWGDRAEAKDEYQIDLVDWDQLQAVDGLIVAVSHRYYMERQAELQAFVRAGGIIIDVKSALQPASIRADLTYWSL
jgi:UDP-N-acetyl-D-glucosamine/UDP-N-acetyl-D-galactosamine dehydrogenase